MSYRPGPILRSFAAAVLLTAGLCAPARAGDFGASSVGTSGSEFLTIDVDARGIAMGTAYTSITNDAYAMYWNPAGLSQVPRFSATAMHNEYLAGIRLQYFAAAHRITDHSVLGAAVRYMDAGDIRNTDYSGNDLGTFRPRNYVYELGWGKNIMEMTDSERDVSLGVVGRFFHSDLVEHANGFAGDIGVQAHYTEAYPPYNFGVALQNIGQGQKFDRVRDSLPFRAKFGTSIYPKPFLLLSLDGVLPISNNPYGALGMELTIDTRHNVKTFLRAGYNTHNRFNGLEGLRGLSLGVGFKFIDLSFDYAFVPYGLLGEAHRFSISWNLPPKRSRRFRRR